MKIVNGQNATLGRLASFVAKEALEGEEVAVVNCDEVIVSGSKKNQIEEFLQKVRRGGTSQKGPRISRENWRVVKRAIRGMLPDHRYGRGRQAYKKIKCYQKIPKELEGKEMTEIRGENKYKYVKLKDITKQ